MAQGIPRDKETVIEAIRPYLQLGYSVRKACINAKVPQSTVQTWIDADDDLRSKVSAWQNMVSAKAREVLAKSVNAGDKNDAKWWLERREKQAFSTRHENTGENGGPMEFVIKRGTDNIE